MVVPEYLTVSGSPSWKFEHPNILYAWEGACLWIPCNYRIQETTRLNMDNLTVYHNYVYNNVTKAFNGTILYQKLKTEKSSQQRVKFLGDNTSNCTLLIHPVKAQDNGQLGLRMTSGTAKWMEPIALNVSGKVLGDGVLCLEHRQGGKWDILTPGTGAENQVARRGQAAGARK